MRACNVFGSDFLIGTYEWSSQSRPFAEDNDGRSSNAPFVTNSLVREIHHERNLALIT